MWIVFRLRYGRNKEFKKSSATLLALVALLGAQYYASDFFLMRFFSFAAYIQMFRLPPVIVNAMLCLAPSCIMAGIYARCFPSALKFFKSRICSFPRIKGGPKEYEFSCSNMSRVMQLRKLRISNGHETNDCAMSVGFFTTECILKYTAYLGLEGFYNSRRARRIICKILQRTHFCLNLLFWVLTAILLFGSWLPDFQTFCSEHPLCNQYARMARAWLSRDVIVNVASVVSSYWPHTSIPKVLSGAFTALAVTFFWLRPVLLWLPFVSAKITRLLDFHRLPNLWANIMGLLGFIKSAKEMNRADVLEVKKREGIREFLKGLWAKFKSFLAQVKVKVSKSGLWIKARLAVIVAAAFLLFILGNLHWKSPEEVN